MTFLTRWYTTMYPYLFKSQTAQPKQFSDLITMKRRDWIFIGICLVVILVVYVSNIREGFVSVNPIPTDADLMSMGTLNTDDSITGTPTSTMQSVLKFIKNYTWSTPLRPNQENRLAKYGIGFFYLDVPYDTLNTLLTGYTTKPTFEKVVNDVNKLAKKPLPDSQISNIIQNAQTSTDLGTQIFYAAYVYIFGADSSSKPAPTQPLTMYISQPCTPSFKSIPGGAVDINCFN